MQKQMKIINWNVSATKKKHAVKNKILNSRLEQQVHTFKISNDPIGHTIKIKTTK